MKNKTGNVSDWEWRLKRLNNSKYLLLLFLPCFIYLVIFRYIPIWGVLISFKDFSLFKGFIKSPWVGLDNFIMFFNNPMAFKLVKNTFLLSLYSILFAYPIQILFALLLNEVRSIKVKMFVQTISYMPHFLSVVVIVGLTKMFLSAAGPVNMLIQSLGMEPTMFMSNPAYFRTIYVIMDIWEGTGWGAIIYLAAMSNIDPSLYESAIIDGASKFKSILHITLPSIAPVIITVFLLNTGNLLSIGFEKIFLMQNPAILSVSEVLSTYVYRQGISVGNLSYATAIDLFNSILSLVLVITSNYMAKRFADYSIF